MAKLATLGVVIWLTPCRRVARRTSSSYQIGLRCSPYILGKSTWRNRMMPNSGAHSRRATGAENAKRP